ncbi:MAG: 16S rRNA (cytosine(1402)-N(4))-methyltransferase RsmH [Candidatus Pacebacteria bacterium]|nr:16S rRNA (cytosine(1402)-N(4))-methyltransferase RsmH [Candidatus Paceibacterota bacterium]
MNQNIKRDEDKIKNWKTIHKPVLLQEIIENLNLGEGQMVFDGTLGGGGYSEEICKKILPSGILIATDLDSDAIIRSKKRLEVFNLEKKFFQENYSNIQKILEELKIEKIDKMILDLGISSDQLASSGRGISFQNLDEDLDMNLSTSLKKEKKASDILNTYSEEDLADIFFYYGGERASKKIAKAIFEARKEKEFKKVKDLVDLIEEEIGYFYKNKKIHSATKIFQALRIAVNDEIKNLEKTLKLSPKILKSGGIVGVVTFHSLEDSLVKRVFREMEDMGVAERINKKVIKPKWNEVKDNPRARSAKLRLLKII